MCHSSGMLCKTFCTAEAYCKLNKFKCIQKTKGFFFSTFHIKGNHSAIGEALFVFNNILFSVLLSQISGEINFLYSRMTGEKSSNFIGIKCLYVHSRHKCFEAAQQKPSGIGPCHAAKKSSQTFHSFDQRF